MATLTLTATENSVRARLTGLQKGTEVGYPRSFEMTLKRGSMFVDYYETSLSATSTSTSVSHNFTGLASNTTYTVKIEVYNSNTGANVANFEDDITTDSPAPPPLEDPDYDVTAPTAYSLKFTYDNGDYDYRYWVIYVVLDNIEIVHHWEPTSNRTYTVTGLSPGTEYKVNVGYSNTQSGATNIGTRYITTPDGFPVTVTTYLDGNYVDSKTGNYTPQQQTINTWITSLHNNKGLRIPDGRFSFALVDGGSTHRTLSYKVTSDHEVDIEAYYVTASQKAYIYDSGQWKLATCYIYNGSTWVEAMPNIYDGGWK